METARTLSAYFTRRENTVFLAHTIGNAKKLLNTNYFDAIILDLLLPDGDGMEIFTENATMPPTLILSTLSEEYKMIECLCGGAADYVIKPCSPELLEARLSLRLLPTELCEIAMHGLTINVATRVVLYNGQRMAITSSEFNILWFLMCHAGKYYDADTIYVSIWEAPSLKQATVRNHLSSLRRKLCKITGRDLIITKFGKGYQFLGDNVV